MSGGTFDYLHSRFEFDHAERTIYKHINSNKRGYSKETIDEFKKGLEHIEKARIYLKRIDWLLADDDGEDSFHRRLKEELSIIGQKEYEEDEDEDHGGLGFFNVIDEW